MTGGIAIVGLNGSGKSTLGHLLAKKIGYFEMDVEDYYFPEQRESRRNALEGKADKSSTDTVPFSAPRDKKQVEQALLDDIRLHPEFIMCGVTLNWSDELLSSIKAVFYLKTPSDVRVDRIKTREESRWGARVSEGGDMYDSQLEFRKMAAGLSETKVSDSIGRLSCDIIELDGTLPPEENAQIIIDYLNK